MSKKLLILSCFYALAIGLISFKATMAYFSDSSNSTNNTFTASESFPSPTPTPEGIANHLVISEVQIAGATADDEFIEIYNPTSSSIDLSVLPLKVHLISGSGSDANRALTFLNNSISAHGFFLIGPSTGYTGVSALDATYNASGTKLVTNGAVYLSNSITNKTGVIDLVGFGTAAAEDREGSSLSNPSANSSVERKALSTSDSASMTSGGSDELKGNGYDTDDNSTNLILRSSSQPQNSTSSTESL